ncbi:MAG: VTT domain-containing protein [Acidobacteriota bacterium]
MKIHPVVLFHKFSAVVFAVLKPLGVWGIGGLALLDAALIPIPGSMDGIISGYSYAQPKKFLLYCLMAAAASTVGSMVPFFVGRAGGELFLLKRINRERYERLRDRFERQEFFAILIPSMGPPPTPLKLFQFGAGVFEMKLAPFLVATFCGKFAQYLVFAVATIWLGPTIFRDAVIAMHRHSNLMLTLGGVALLAVGFYVVRKVFDRKRAIELPIDDEE